MWIGVITLFPDMFSVLTGCGVVGRAIQKGLLVIKFWNPRVFSNNRHRSIDNYIYGGGPGMLMMVQPLKDAILCAKDHAGNDVKVIYLSPQGKKLNQDIIVNKLSTCSKLILVCGRYKGIDERLIISEVDEELSIGDYILSGGELAAMVLIDSISRFIPGVLNCITSAREDTYFDGKGGGMFAPPHYTRPALFDGMAVPNVLLSGNHYEISKWRLKESLGRTWVRRPELLKNIVLTDKEQELLSEFKNEFLNKSKSDFY